MPSTTEKQARFMAACAHGANYESCPSKKVSKEFNQADKGSKMLKRVMSFKEHLEISEGYFENAQKHLEKAKKAEKNGDIDAYHAHMIDHHEEMAKWSDSKGRYSISDTHYERSRKHAAAIGLKEATIHVNMKQMNKWKVDQDNVKFFDNIHKAKGKVETLDSRGYKHHLDHFGIFYTLKEAAEVDLDQAAEKIAKKHGVSVESIKSQVKMGIKVEHEHTTDDKQAEKIALDHLDEIPDYYTKLNRMEKVNVDQINNRQF